MTSPKPIALQLWTIRESLALDVDRALGEVKAAGFSSVELAPLQPGLTVEFLAECLNRHGLSVVSIHGDLLTLENLKGWNRLVKACRCSKIIWHGWPRDPRFDSLDGVRELIDAYNHSSKIAGDHGYQFGIHNHWWEFEPIDGELPIRLFHERLRPEIFWQLDVYWAKTAGFDPAMLVGKYKDRIQSIHWKDGPAIHGEPMVALGEGTVDLLAILRNLARPVDSIIELDECATDPLAAAEGGRLYLESKTRSN